MMSIKILTNIAIEGAYLKMHKVPIKHTQVQIKIDENNINLFKIYSNTLVIRKSIQIPIHVY